jgi:hypothetical protein
MGEVADTQRPGGSTPLVKGCAAAAVLVLIVLVLPMFGTFPAPFEFLWHFATGWLRHLIVNLPHLRWNPTTILLSLGCGAAAVALLHRFVRSLAGRPIPPAVTLRATGIFLAATAAAIAMTGIVHELAWLARSPITYDRSAASRTEAISNAKQLYLALLELDQEGIHPKSIEEIVRHYPECKTLATHRPLQGGGIREPFVLFHPGVSISKRHADTPLLGALGRSEGKEVILLADGSVETMTAAELELRLSTTP